VSGTTFRGDPYRVLDVRHDASTEDIKRRWRELAREHHPDRAGTDGEERERLTTRMARINAAYDLLRDPVRRARYNASPEARRAREGWTTDRATPPPGPPPPPVTRPVTARFDTSAHFWRRNARTSLGRSPLRGQPPLDRRRWAHGRDLRASTPTGPVHRSLAGQRAHPPSLEDARSTVLGFGRFHGQTLGQVADRDPGYVEWIASTITRDRDLVIRARVVAAARVEGARDVPRR
jgi:curved DNA-binding protein CbpA